MNEDDSRSDSTIEFGTRDYLPAPEPGFKPVGRYDQKPPPSPGEKDYKTIRFSYPGDPDRPTGEELLTRLQTQGEKRQKIEEVQSQKRERAIQKLEAMKAARKKELGDVATGLNDTKDPGKKKSSARTLKVVIPAGKHQPEDKVETDDTASDNESEEEDGNGEDAQQTKAHGGGNVKGQTRQKSSPYTKEELAQYRKLQKGALKEYDPENPPEGKNGLKEGILYNPRELPETLDKAPKYLMTSDRFVGFCGQNIKERTVAQRHEAYPDTFPLAGDFLQGKDRRANVGLPALTKKGEVIVWVSGGKNRFEYPLTGNLPPPPEGKMYAQVYIYGVRKGREDNPEVSKDPDTKPLLISIPKRGKSKSSEKTLQSKRSRKNEKTPSKATKKSGFWVYRGNWTKSAVGKSLKGLGVKPVDGDVADMVRQLEGWVRENGVEDGMNFGEVINMKNSDSDDSGSEDEETPWEYNGSWRSKPLRAICRKYSISGYDRMKNDKKRMVSAIEKHINENRLMDTDYARMINQVERDGSLVPEELIVQVQNDQVEPQGANSRINNTDQSPNQRIAPTNQADTPKILQTRPSNEASISQANIFTKEQFGRSNQASTNQADTPKILQTRPSNQASISQADIFTKEQFGRSNQTSISQADIFTKEQFGRSNQASISQANIFTKEQFGRSNQASTNQADTPKILQTRPSNEVSISQADILTKEQFGHSNQAYTNQPIASTPTNDPNKQGEGKHPWRYDGILMNEEIRSVCDTLGLDWRLYPEDSMGLIRRLEDFVREKELVNHPLIIRINDKANYAPYSFVPKHQSRNQSVGSGSVELSKTTDDNKRSAASQEGNPTKRRRGNLLLQIIAKQDKETSIKQEEASVKEEQVNTESELGFPSDISQEMVRMRAELASQKEHIKNLEQAEIQTSNKMREDAELFKTALEKERSKCRAEMEFEMKTTMEHDMARYQARFQAEMEAAKANFQTDKETQRAEYEAAMTEQQRQHDTIIQAMTEANNTRTVETYGQASEDETNKLKSEVARLDQALSNTVAQRNYVIREFSSISQANRDMTEVAITIADRLSCLRTKGSSTSMVVDLFENETYPMRRLAEKAPVLASAMYSRSTADLEGVFWAVDSPDINTLTDLTRADVVKVVKGEDDTWMEVVEVAEGKEETVVKNSIGSRREELKEGGYRYISDARGHIENGGVHPSRFDAVPLPIYYPVLLP